MAFSRVESLSKNRLCNRSKAANYWVVGRPNLVHTKAKFVVQDMPEDTVFISNMFCTVAAIPP